MKTRTLLCALSLLAMLFATGVSAEARNYIPRTTTVVRLADMAGAVVVAKLNRVENIKKGDTLLREAVLSVQETLLGSELVLNGEIRVKSMRNMTMKNYDEDLRTGEALYFIARDVDGKLKVIMDERGTVSAEEVGGDLNATVDLTRAFLTAKADNPASRFALIRESLIGAIDLSGSRLSIDACLELSWNHGDYAATITETEKQKLVNLAQASEKGSGERRELITTIGRYKPEGGSDALFGIMLADKTFSTTSLSCWALEQIDRGDAITRLVNDYAAAAKDQKMIMVRALGLIRPKLGHDGAALRTRALDIVKGELRADNDKAMLGEALIAARDMRSGDAHIEILKTMIDNRAGNGLGLAQVKGCIVALAAARSSESKDATVYAKDYLKTLAENDAVLKQYVDGALKFPWTTLIAGADGRER